MIDPTWTSFIKSLRRVRGYASPDGSEIIPIISASGSERVGSLALSSLSTTASTTLSAPNTYSYTMAQDAEWGRLTPLPFLTAAQRLDPLGTDCTVALQTFFDYLRDANQTTGVHVKYANLARRTYLVSSTLSVRGLQVSGGVRRGRIIVREGGLKASATWVDQTTNPDPLIQFTNDSSGSGIQDVYIDCNGVCSGILVRVGDSAGGNSKITIDGCTIVNFANPQKLTQSSLYNNCTSVNGHSLVPVRRYESSAAHPYGIRIGPKDVTDGTISTATCRISGNQMRQWQLGRTELTSFQKRTGIGIWIAASDVYLMGKENNCDDVLVSMINEGNNTIISAYHSSPSGGSSEYDANDGPTSDVMLIGTENRSGTNVYNGCYHERYMWLHDPQALIANCLFPRNASSTDANTGCIILDATSAAQVLPALGKPQISGLKHASTLANEIEYREAGGFTWANKPLTAAVDSLGRYGVTANGAPAFTSDGMTLMNGDGTGDPQYIHSSHANRSQSSYKANGSTKYIRVGTENDKFSVRDSGTPIISANAAAGWDFQTTSAAATILKNGGTTFLSAANVASFSGGLAAASTYTIAARTLHTGGVPAQVSTEGTDTTPVVTETYIAEVFIPANVTVTGVSVLNGTAVAGNIRVALYDSTGALLNNSPATAASGTAAYQRVPFNSTVSAKGPATFYVMLQSNNVAHRFRSHLFGDFGTTKQTAQTFGTFTSFTPPTTFTASTGPIASLY